MASPGVALAQGEVTLYKGELTVLDTSVSACLPEDKRTSQVELVLHSGPSGGAKAFTGYFQGEALLIGQFSGAGFDRLQVVYPFQDRSLAEGHHLSLKLHRANNTLTGELRQKSFAESAPLCTIVGATLALRKAGSGSEAIRREEELGQLFQAEKLVEQGLFYVGDGQFDKALRPFREALEIKDRILGEGHPATLFILIHVALAYRDLGRVPEALPVLEKALTLSMKERGEQHPETLISLETLALTYRDLGRLPEAVPLFEKALKVRTELQGDLAPDTLASLGNLAHAYRDTGRLREALPLFEKRLKLHTEGLGERDPNTLVSLNKVAQVYFDLGHVPEALALFERSLELTMKVPRAQFNLARHLDALRKFPEAVPLLEKALKLATREFGERDRRTLRYLEDLALAYVGHGRLEEALPLFEKSLSLHSAEFGQQDPQTIASRQLDHETLASRNRLALAYRDLGRWSEAVPLFERLVKVYTERASERRWIATLTPLIESSANLARAYKAQGRPKDALGLSAKFVEDVEYLRTAVRGITAEQRQGLLTRGVSTYKMFSGLHISHGQSPEAFRLAELSKARTLLESSALRRAYQGVAVELSQSDRQKVREYESQLASLNEQIPQSRRIVRETESDVVHEYESRIGMRNEQRVQFDQKVREYEYRVGGSDHPVVAPAWGHRLSEGRLEMEQIEVVKKFDALRAELASKYPKYRRLSEITIIGAEEGERLIPEDAVFLSYLLDGDTPLAFVITAEQGLQAKALDAVPGLGQTVEAYRQLLSYPDGAMGLARETGNRAWRLPDGSFALARNAPEEGAEKVTGASVVGGYLAAKLLTPVLSQIAAKRHWIISPDGALAMLPFETLPLEAEPVLAKYDVSYLQSLSMLALLRQRGNDYEGLRQRKSLLAMGGALYAPASRASGKESSKSKEVSTESLAQVDAMLSHAWADPNAVTRAFDLLEKTWGHLPGSEKEVDDVAQLFGPEQATVYKKTQATEAKLQELNARQELRNYRYLLFATHGYLSTESPALSSLVLGQIDPTPGTDGYVTAAEWPGYDLASDLMVFSACDTGVGTIVHGEGIVGLPYAFYVAGTKNTVLSLWPVADVSTADFMPSFFAKIKAGVPQIQALNQTKREFMKHEKFSKPAFWAPFVLYGT